MNLDQMITRTNTYLDDPNGRRFRRPVVIDLLNAGQADVKRVAEAQDKHAFVGISHYTVVAATDALEFTMPADFASILTVERLGSGTPIPGVRASFETRHPVGYREATTVAENSTEPPVYYLRGNTLGIVAPGSGYTLRVAYSKSLANLADNADVSDIPADFHDLVCLCAAKRGYASQGQSFPGEFEQLRSEQMGDLVRLYTSRDSNLPQFVNLMDA